MRITGDIPLDILYNFIKSAYTANLMEHIVRLFYEIFFSYSLKIYEIKVHILHALLVLVRNMLEEYAIKRTV